MKEGYKETDVGVIPVDWGVNTINSVSQKINVGFVGTCEKFYTDKTNGVLMLRTGNVKEGKIDLKNLKYISYDFHTKNTKSQLQANDLLIARHGSSGLCSIVPNDFPKANCLNIVMIRIDIKKSNPTFMMYLFNSEIVQQQMKQRKAGSTQGVVNTKEIAKTTVVIPPLKEQEKIADILSTADDKIEAIASQIQKAETLKKGLLQKLLSEGIGHTEFKDSELGRIPVGWEVVKFKDILTVKYGKSQKDVEDENGEYPILGTGGLMGYANKFLCNKPSVLIGRKGTIDKPQYKDTPFWTVDTLFYTDIKEDLALAKYVYCKFLTIQWRTYNEASGVPSLSAPNIHAIKMQLPPLEEQKQIATILSTADEKLEVLRAKKEKYETLKQGLMQKLLTGEVRVSA